MRAIGAPVFVLALAVLAAASATHAAEPTVIGEIVAERYETPHPYPSGAPGAPQLVWVDEVYFPGATYVALHFERLELAEGDFVVVRSVDGEQRWTYARFGRHDLGIADEGFFATHVKGDAVVIELYASDGPPGYGYAVDRFGRGYTDDEIAWFWSQGLGEEMNLPYPPAAPESVCTADDTREAACYRDSEPAAYNAARAVARLLLNGSAHCTGWLIGNAGHLMTNQHCIGSQTTMNNIDFEFMAEGATCATNCASALACPGAIEASGGTFVVADSALDYALVVPDTSTGTGTVLADTYGFMRLRESGPVLHERVYHPQHPAGWGKRFAMESTYPEDVALGGKCYVVSLSEVPCSGGAYDVGYWNDTQGGSSGSPVLGWSDNRVVALHHCRGSAFCTTGNPSTDDPNRGVPIDAVIADLGALLPPGALCDPYDGPAHLTATPNGDNRVDLTWDPVMTGRVTYTVYRAFGACPQPEYEELASGLAGTTYADTTVSGGLTYAYVVLALDSEGCESDLSPCAEATATGLCIQPPDFAGLDAASNAQTASCAIELTWSPATNHCGSSVVYNVYRSESTGFDPGPDTLLASCRTQTSFTDEEIPTQVYHHYVVRAEDDSGNGSGPCAAGNEEQNLVERPAAATGPDTLLFASSFDLDDGGLVGTRDWEWGASYAFTSANCTSTTYSPPPAPHSGVGMWGTVLNSCYNNLGNNAGYTNCVNTSPGDDSILSFTIDLTGIASAQLCWWEWPDLYLYWDWGQVTVNGEVVFEHCGGSYTAPTAWARECVDLSPYAGAPATVEYHMMASTTVNRGGWYVDDLEVFYGSDCITALFVDDFESGTTDAWSVTQP